MDFVSIAWLEVSQIEMLAAIEAVLIKYFTLILNQRPISEPKPLLQSRYPIRWRLRVLMTEKNIGNKQLAEISGLHRITISKLPSVVQLGQINGDTINSVLNKLYKQKGDSKILTPSDLIEYTPDLEAA